MAMAFNFDNTGEVFIHLDTAFECGNSPVIYLMANDSFYDIGETETNANIIKIKNNHFIFERSILCLPTDCNIVITVYDRGLGSVVHAENLSFHHSFFNRNFDFAKSKRMPPFLAEDYKKPGFLAIFTHVYNDNDMLRFWQKFYSRLAPHKDLYVIDHGSTTPPQEVLHPEINVVRIPRGEVDHDNISEFCNYFQRFLLSQYRWVIHTDADELLVDRGGVDAFLGKLQGDNRAVIVKPQHQFTIIHDERTETAIDFDRPISLQRRRMRPNTHDDKPVLASMHTTWAQGFHSAMEDRFIWVDPDLYLMHLQWVDLSLTLKKHAKWKHSPLSDRDKVFVEQASKIDDMDKLRQTFKDRLSEETVADIPDWMRGAL